MAKKENSWNYWEMNYKGKFKRTLVMIPICIVLCIVAPFYTDYEYDTIWIGVVVDIVLVVTCIAQLIYTYKKMKEEEGER